MAASKVRQYVLLPFLLALVSALNAVLTLASLLPWFKKARHRFFLRVAEVQENNAMGKLWEEVGDVEYFWPRMKELWYSAWAEVQMVAEQGSRAPNPKLLRLSDRSECRLLDVASKGRPLIINFGSCT
ncbi:thyroxine 5-deiodinase-like isoform X2 [Portunus trituberculatus]|uniref:thyroxine 5-deiodinase-like isoform X2 n=1 Tax=Portunus trituberculatus TaxID=210409 RepID=UPI001E1CF2BF|nr:thyroxine 5-deiodinase-like isoform X2 [Portunus trituberculatus]